MPAGVCLGWLSYMGLRRLRLGDHEEGFLVNLLSSVYTEDMVSSGFFGYLINSKATPVLIPPKRTPSAKPFGEAKAESHQWRNSTFDEQLFRDTITKICCGTFEA